MALSPVLVWNLKTMKLAGLISEKNFVRNYQN